MPVLAAQHLRGSFIPPVNRSTPAFQVVDLPRASRRRRSKRASVPAKCDTQITPDCLQALYNIPTTAASATGNSLGVSVFIEEIANQDDLTVSLIRETANRT